MRTVYSKVHRHASARLNFQDVIWGPEVPVTTPKLVGARRRSVDGMVMGRGLRRSSGPKQGDGFA